MAQESDIPRKIKCYNSTNLAQTSQRASLYVPGLWLQERKIWCSSETHFCERKQWTEQKIDKWKCFPVANIFLPLVGTTTSFRGDQMKLCKEDNVWSHGMYRGINWIRHLIFSTGPMKLENYPLWLACTWLSLRENGTIPNCVSGVIWKLMQESHSR